jgi:hypothetical protein
MPGHYDSKGNARRTIPAKEKLEKALAGNPMTVDVAPSIRAHPSAQPGSSKWFKPKKAAAAPARAQAARTTDAQALEDAMRRKSLDERMAAARKRAAADPRTKSK